MKFNQLLQTLCCDLREDGVLIIALRAGLGSVHLVQILFSEMVDRKGWTNRIIARDDSEIYFAQKLVAKDDMLFTTMTGIAKANIDKDIEKIKSELGVTGLRFMTVQANFTGELSENKKAIIDANFEDYTLVYIDKDDDGNYTLKYA